MPCRRRRARPRTCCASWRRRSSARSYGGTASSTPARTRCRRRSWPRASSGRATVLPDNPRAWLTTVASRRLVDEWRSESSRRRREEDVAALGGARPRSRCPTHDDTLTLLFLCCHPALSAPSQLALTLRAVGGLTTKEIAQAFLVPEATMAQRISRAKQSIRAAGSTFELPAPAGAGRTARDRPAGPLPAVQRGLHDQLPARGCSAPTSRRRPSAWPDSCTGCCLQRARSSGLLALMLLTDARRAARTTDDGLLVPLAEQDRTSGTTGRSTRASPSSRRTLGAGPARAVPGAGGDRGRARRVADSRGDRLAADPRALRGARGSVTRPRRDAQPRRGSGDGRRPTCRARAARHARRRRAAGPHPPRGRGARAPARAGGRARGCA